MTVFPQSCDDIRLNFISPGACNVDPHSHSPHVDNDNGFLFQHCAQPLDELIAAHLQGRQVPAHAGEVMTHGASSIVLLVLRAPNYDFCQLLQCAQADVASACGADSACEAGS